MTCRSFVVALSIGLLALPAAGASPGTAGAAESTGAQPQAVSQVGTRDGATAAPEGTYRWDKTGSVQPATVPLPDERASARETIVRIAQAALMIGLIGLGLAITFKSLFSDMKQRRRVAYRPRGR